MSKIQDLQAEFMELMQAGNRAAFDFALENSDEANYALQHLGMELMKCASAETQMKHLSDAHWATAFGLWGSCARQTFLDVVEIEVAPLWADQEYPKRVAELEEMREEQEA